MIKILTLSLCVLALSGGFVPSYAQDEDLQYGIVLCDSMEGWLEKARGRRDKAAECLKRALELAQKVHGPDHAKTKALETQIAWLDKPTVQIASGVSSTHLA